MGTGLRGRMALAGMSIAALVALSACAPAQPPPEPGGATLSAAIIPYDHPRFLTNQPPLLQPGHECTRMNTVLQALKVTTAELPYQVHDLNTHASEGCLMTFSDADVTVTASPLPFSQYWVGSIPDGAPGFVNALGNHQVGSLERMVLARKFYAVQFATDQDTSQAECNTAVDTGSPEPVVVTVSLLPPKGQDPLVTLTEKIPLSRILSQYCPIATKFASRMLTIIDSHGGSRATT